MAETEEEILYYTLQDCTQNNICSLADAYTIVAWMILGVSVISDEEWSTSLIMVLLIVFAFFWVWWIGSVILVMLVSEPMDRSQQLALTWYWYWEPKVAITATTTVTTPKLTPTPPSWSSQERYCDSTEGLWHVLLTSSLAAAVGTNNVSSKKHEHLWYYAFAAFDPESFT
jgi:hypothetical protein